MRKSFKYRLYPNREQSLALDRTLETHRRLYNSSLEWRKNAYESEKKSVNYSEQSARLTTVRAGDKYLSQINFSSSQHTLRRLNTAFQNFFRRIKKNEKPGYPRFKGYWRFDSFKFTYRDGCQIKNSKLVLQFVGAVKVKWHRDIPETARITSTTIHRQSGKWYAVFSCELPDITMIPSINPSVGIDLGLKSFLVTSDGEHVEAPKFYRKAQKKLRITQRSLALKKKGGNRRKKAVIKVAKIHHHIGNQRKDFHHKTAYKLVKQYGFISHENLSIQGLSRGMLAKSVNDAGWGYFLSILRQKAVEAGVVVVGINPSYTTQACSSCGCIPDKKVTLSDRVYHCESCGLVLDRDYNAAINILNSGRTVLSGVNVEVFDSYVA